MVSRIAWRLTAVAFSIVLAVGCAKQEMVKKDETPPSAGTQATEKKAEAAPGEQGKEPQGMKEQPLKEEAVPPSTISEAKPESGTAGTQGTLLTGKLESAKQGMILETVYFDFDSYIIEPAAKDALEKNATQLKLNPSVRIAIEGHCDERGADDYNLALGEKRAKAVEDYLVTLGISADRLSIISYGKEKPADTGHDEAAWAKNRRAVLVIQK